MKKETVTMFNLEAAFKALDEIDAPKTSGERFKANRVNLKEYFNTKTAHEVLVEDYFDVNDTDDLNAAKEEREAEVAKAKLARIEKIVDLDAETEEDILPSYVGKMIMQCPQCMTLFYKNEEDIEKSEETPDVVNINEICQHCGNSSGYTLVGKVGGIDESEAENFDLDEIEVDENELDLDFPEEGTEEVDAEGTGEAGEAMEDEGEDLDLDLDFDFDEEEEQEEANESLHGSKLLDKIEDKNDLKTDIESEHLTLNEDFEDATGTDPIDSFEVFIDRSGSGEQAKKAADPVKAFADQHPEAEMNVQYFDDFSFSEPLAAAKAGKKVVVYTDDDYKTNCPELETFENVTIINVMQEELLEDLADWYRKTFDRPASISTQQAWEDELNGEMGEISDKRRKHLERKFAQQRDWEERHPDKAPKVPVLTPIAAEEAEEPVAVGESMHNSELLDKIEDKNDLKTEIESDHLTLTEAYTVKYGRGGKEVDFETMESAIAHINQGMKARAQDHYVLYKDGEELIWIDWYSANEDGSDYNYSVARQSDKSLAFDKNRGLSVIVKEENDVDIRSMIVRELGSMGSVKGAINTGAKLAKFRCVVDNNKPSTLDLDNKVIYYNKNEVLPEVCKKFVAQMTAANEDLQEDATDELFDKLWSRPQPTDAETEANLATMGEAMTSTEDFDELDDAFDEHITEYLKEVYSNIESYNSTNCSMRGKKLVVEGLIKFQSGKTKTTRFTFDSNKRINNTLVFRGMNEGLTSDRSAFRLACRADNKKLVTENLSYKYTIDGANVTGKTKKH